MSRADEIAAKAKRLAARDTPQATEEAAAPVATSTRRTSGSSPVRSVRTTPVRITTDLPPVDHRELVRWCANAAAELGRPRVHGQEVVRALVARLLADPTLAAAVLDDLAT